MNEKLIGYVDATPKELKKLNSVCFYTKKGILLCFYTKKGILYRSSSDKDVALYFSKRDKSDIYEIILRKVKK